MSMPWYMTAVRRGPDSEWEILCFEDGQDVSPGAFLFLGGARVLVTEAVFHIGESVFSDDLVETTGDGWPIPWLTVVPDYSVKSSTASR
jgi:hypothetical protein